MHIHKRSRDGPYHSENKAAGNAPRGNAGSRHPARPRRAPALGKGQALAVAAVQADQLRDPAALGAPAQRGLVLDFERAPQMFRRMHWNFENVGCISYDDRGIDSDLGESIATIAGS